MRGDGLQKGGWEEGVLLKQKAAEEEKRGWQGEGGIGRGIRGKMNCVFFCTHRPEMTTASKSSVPCTLLSLQHHFSELHQLVCNGV